MDSGSATINVVDLGSQIAKALAAAHSAGITFRDIKPDNMADCYFDVSSRVINIAPPASNR